MKKLGLFGDSFGYQASNQPFKSWVDLLGNDFAITNHCQCGVSEYKILQQLKNTDLDKFDVCLITHTSATRIFVQYNPLHRNSESHQNCDIIYADIADRYDDFSMACQQYFKHIFDLDYSVQVYNMICKEIHQLCSNKKVLHITHFDQTKLYNFPGMVNFHSLWQKYKGTVNHYDQTGNEILHQNILKNLS